MRRTHHLGTPLLLTAAMLLLGGQLALAQSARSMEGPNVGALDRGTLERRERAIRGNRAQAWSPSVQRETVARLRPMAPARAGSETTNAFNRVAQPVIERLRGGGRNGGAGSGGGAGGTGAGDPGASGFAQQISSAPAHARTEIFAQLAAEAGTPVTQFTRRMRGMVTENGKTRVGHASKRFFEVTPDTFDVFRRVHGGNTVWFAINDSPNHLHTLIADQGGGQRFHHNTYGVQTGDATITGNFTQYAMGVQLTDREMDRFVRYTNAAMANASHYTDAGKLRVFGFYNSRKEKVSGTDQIRCTNWATTAPVGDLPRWVRTVDRRLTGLANGGQLASVPELTVAGGLHSALASTGSSEQRADIVRRVLASDNLTKWNRSAVKRLHKAFERELNDFPARPADLVLRQSLAQMLGLSRSQDPAKWSYDLMMSKRVPVIAVLNGRSDPNLAQKTFNMEVMGQIAPSGVVTPSSFRDYSTNRANLGVIPPGRSPHAPAATSPNQ